MDPGHKARDDNYSSASAAMSAPWVTCWPSVDGELGDAAGAGGVQHVLHLHGLDHGDAVALGDHVAGLDEQFRHPADDGRAYGSPRRPPLRPSSHRTSASAARSAACCRARRGHRRREPCAPCAAPVPPQYHDRRGTGPARARSTAHRAASPRRRPGRSASAAGEGRAGSRRRRSRARPGPRRIARPRQHLPDAKGDGHGVEGARRKAVQLAGDEPGVHLGPRESRMRDERMQEGGVGLRPGDPCAIRARGRAARWPARDRRRRRSAWRSSNRRRAR